MALATRLCRECERVRKEEESGREIRRNMFATLHYHPSSSFHAAIRRHVDRSPLVRLAVRRKYGIDHQLWYCRNELRYDYFAKLPLPFPSPSSVTLSSVTVHCALFPPRCLIAKTLTISEAPPRSVTFRPPSSTPTNRRGEIGTYFDNSPSSTNVSDTTCVMIKV
mgnify:CR=1 FL=1